MKYELMSVKLDRDRMSKNSDHSKTLDSFVLNDEHIDQIIFERMGPMLNKYGEIDQKKL